MTMATAQLDTAASALASLAKGHGRDHLHVCRPVEDGFDANHPAAERGRVAALAEFSAELGEVQGLQAADMLLSAEDAEQSLAVAFVVVI